MWGYPVGCPEWIPCKWKVPDIICIAGCEIQKGWTKFTAWAEQVGIKVGLRTGYFILLNVKM